MDVIISAPQGGGKTTAAMHLATGYLNATSWNTARPNVLIFDVGPLATLTPEQIADTIRVSSAPVVMFDGSITSNADFLVAIQAVKLARNAQDKAPYTRDLLAIYCEQHGTGAVVLQFDDKTVNNG